MGPRHPLSPTRPPCKLVGGGCGRADAMAGHRAAPRSLLQPLVPFPPQPLPTHPGNPHLARQSISGEPGVVDALLATQAIVASRGQPNYMGARIPLPTDLHFSKWQQICVTPEDVDINLRFACPLTKNQAKPFLQWVLNKLVFLAMLLLDYASLPKNMGTYYRITWMS